MCGIAGIIGSKIEGKEKIIRQMTGAISHRGPDDDGFYADENAALGMRRLAIIDLTHGDQPIFSDDGRMMIFFNGEIYNYKELKKDLTLRGRHFTTESDTEVVLKMYEEYGEACLPRLRGMFAFVIYEPGQKKLFLARDFFGIKPLYYLTSAELSNSHASPGLAGLRRDSNLESSASVLAFASEIKSFLKIPGFKPEVNDEAVYNFLSFQYNPLEETFFKGVYKLPPAHFMTVNTETGMKHIERYWQFRFEQEENLNEDKTRAEILQTMEDSVTHHMIADVPVGSFLSGGIDSSIIATLMSRSLSGSRPQGSGQKVKTFTVTFDTVSEGVDARETSEPLGTDHTEIKVGKDEYFKELEKAVWHFDEPVADPSAIGLYFLAREARKHVKVVLSGEGADELFGGYNIYLEPYARRWLSWLPRPVLSILAILPVNFRGKNYLGRASKKMEEWYIGNASIFKDGELARLWRGQRIEKLSLKKIYQEAQGYSDSTKMQYVDIHTWLVGDILAKADKMTMAHSLELRVPFLDKKVARLASKLPDKFKWRGGETKYLLREAFKSILPESVRKRKKLGFPTPVRHWLNKDAEILYTTILSNNYIKQHMDTMYIRRLINSHTEGKVDNSRKIYLLLVLAIWYNQFITKKDDRHN